MQALTECEKATGAGAARAAHGGYDWVTPRLAVGGCLEDGERGLARLRHWVAQHLAAGRRVYIHCQHGIGRSALLAACTPLEALTALKCVRPRVSPSPPQLRTLLRWARRTHRGTQPRVTLADLGRIAWTRS